MRRVAPTHSAGSSSRRPRIRRGSDLVERVISNLDRLTRDLDAADRAASVGGREAAHGHVASLRPYRLSAGSRCAEQPKPARQRDPARMVRAKILAPHRGARRARASPGRRRGAWRALAIDRHALAFGPGHGAGGLDHVGDVVWPFGVGESVASKVGAQHAPSPRLRGRHGRLGGDGAAWAAQEESRAQQRVDRTARLTGAARCYRVVQESFREFSSGGLDNTSPIRGSRFRGVRARSLRHPSPIRDGPRGITPCTRR